VCPRTCSAKLTFTLPYVCTSLPLAQGVHAKIVQEVIKPSTVAITPDLYSEVGRAFASNRSRASSGLLRPSVAVICSRGASLV
jgi:hypothetical protein